MDVKLHGVRFEVADKAFSIQGLKSEFANSVDLKVTCRSCICHHNMSEHYHYVNPAKKLKALRQGFQVGKFFKK